MGSPMPGGGASSPNRLGLSSQANNAAGDIDEAEARYRAREILQDFVREKGKAVEMESQLHRAHQEVDRLNHVVAEQKAELAMENDRLKRQLDNAKSELMEAQTRANATRDEVQKVAKASAQRVADTTSQLRLKEQEIEHLELELTRAREEIRNLRKDLLLARDSDNLGEDAARIQQRVVEIARKLLDSEKSKTALQKSIVDDRKHYHQALLTIESLRKQLAECEQRAADSALARNTDISQFQTTIEAMQKEMMMQRDLYKDFVAKVSSGGQGGGNRFDDSPSAGGGNSGTRIAVLETQLRSMNDTQDMLKQQLESAHQELSATRNELTQEKHRRVEDLSIAHSSQLKLEQEVEHARREAHAKHDAARQEAERFAELMVLHESIKRQLDEKANTVLKLERAVQDIGDQHNAVASEMELLREEYLARDAAVRQLKEFLSVHNSTEARMREQQIIHNHEKELLRLQFIRQGGGTNLSSFLKQDGRGDNAGRIEVAAHMDLAHAQQQIALLETEKSRWENERTTQHQSFDQERAALIGEIKATKKQLDDALLENAQLRSQALHCQREVEEWRLAFHSSERAKSRIEHQLQELRDNAGDSQKERSSLEMQCAMLTQHVDRLESQADRDAQEIFKLRREVALTEVNLARHNLHAKLDELRRTEKQDVIDASGAISKEKQLIQLRAERQQLERDVQDKEVAMQRLHEQQLQVLSGKGHR